MKHINDDIKLVKDEERESRAFLMAYLRDNGFTVEEAERMIEKGTKALADALHIS